MIVTDSGPAGRNTSANPQASAAIAPTAVHASRTLRRVGSMITTSQVRPAYKMGTMMGIAIQAHGGPPGNQLRACQLSPLPPTPTSVNFLPAPPHHSGSAEVRCALLHRPQSSSPSSPAPRRLPLQNLPPTPA